MYKYDIFSSLEERNEKMLGKTVFRRPGAYILAPLFAGNLPALLSHCFLICGMELNNTGTELLGGLSEQLCGIWYRTGDWLIHSLFSVLKDFKS